MIKYILLVLLIASCNEDCEPGDIRCKKHIEQRCDEEGDWMELTNCAEILSFPQEEWTCCHSSDLWDGGPGCNRSKNCK